MPGRKSSQAGKKRRGAAKAAYVVFISHSSADLWIAEQIAKEVTAAGAQPWLDELDLEGGDNLRERIINGIAACREAIVLITPQSLKSRWVAFEIGAAFGQRKRVTPILHYVPPEKIEILADVKAIDLNQFDQFLTQLRQRVQR